MKQKIGSIEPHSDPYTKKTLWSVGTDILGGQFTVSESTLPQAIAYIMADIIIMKHHLLKRKKR